MKKKLNVRFNRLDGKKAELVFANPRDDITPAEIHELVEKITSKKFFIISGMPLVSLDIAFVRTVEDEAIVG